VNNVLGDVHVDSVVKDGDEIDFKTVVIPFQREKKLRSYSFPKCTRKHHLVQMKFWENLVGRSHNKRGWLLDGHLEIWIDYVWHFKQANDDWAMASPYLSDMLLRCEFPLFTLIMSTTVSPG
ncbi:hypothetical protein Tco_1240409, partial [Tanacetum coccineum]